MTGDPKRIEEVVARVDALVKPLEDYKFDPFAQDCAVSWKKVIKWFNREVEGIEAEAKRFIDESFKYLRSAEGAFDLLLKVSLVVVLSLIILNSSSNTSNLENQSTSK